MPQGTRQISIEPSMQVRERGFDSSKDYITVIQAQLPEHSLALLRNARLSQRCLVHLTVYSNDSLQTIFTKSLGEDRELNFRISKQFHQISYDVREGWQFLACVLHRHFLDDMRNDS